ncbi:MAG TPA: CpXC domain-containing protein [Polyangia bacterium]
MGSRVYQGGSARSRRQPVVYACPCGERFRAVGWRAVDSSDAEATARLLDGALNRVRCPSCEATAELELPVIYHDLERPRLVLVLPDSLRHRELEERAEFWKTLAGDAEPPPLYVLEAQVVFGPAGLRAVLAPAPSPEEFHHAPTPTPSVTPAEVVPPPARAPVEEATRPRIDPAELRRAKKPTGDEEDGQTRVRMLVPDPRAAMIERWIAGREGPQALLVDDAVLVCASLPPPALECFLDDAGQKAGKIELRVQLHRLPSYPLVALTLVAPAGRRDIEARVLTVPLDLARAAHRVVLDALGRQAALTLELYDSDYLPVVSHRVVAPLEENVRRVIFEAKDALERLAPQSRSFERARAMLMQPGYDRLGRATVALPDDELEPLERPGAVLAALAQVARFSEPNAEAYLVEIRSMPLVAWRSLRARVIRRALDLGIAVPRPLVERSAKESTAPLPSWQELLAIQVRRFSEVSSRQRQNDLSAAEEAENWDLLLRECALAGVIVDDEVRQLAAASLKRARAGAGGGIDLRGLATSELTTLLERRELRREAAVILCERHETPTLPALFSVVRRMPRGEANLVLPAVTAFGAAAEKWLIDGLRSKKAFMRQGCALALGVLKTPLGVDALVRLLLFEPTEIWSEVARAIGDVGAQAVMPLAARLREADGERQGRIVQALAHIAAHGLKAPIEALAAGRDALVASAAARALTLSAEIKLAHEVVRHGQGPGGSPAEQTVVRGFSRRFYEALDGGSGAIELDARELEELKEGELEEIDEAPELLGELDDGPDEPRTATDIPVLREPARRDPVPRDEDTSPIPKSSLPGDRG